MTITREQLTDLEVGDVVELSWPSLSDPQVSHKVQGPVKPYDPFGTSLFLGPYCVRDIRGNPVHGEKRTLTVISRAPRPFYVNHSRTEPARGDVVRAAEGGIWAGTIWIKTDKYWHSSGDMAYRRQEMPTRLHLLVDGTTGQVIP